MSDPTQRHLERLARRQRYLLVLLVYPYLVAATWLAMDGISPRTVFAIVIPAVAIVVLAYLVVLVRSRRAPDGDTGSSVEQ